MNLDRINTSSDQAVSLTDKAELKPIYDPIKSLEELNAAMKAQGMGGATLDMPDTKSLYEPLKRIDPSDIDMDKKNTPHFLHQPTLPIIKLQYE